MSDVSYRPDDVLRVLNDFGVRYIVIGGIAAIAHGSPDLTFDLDVCYARDRENFAALALALKSLDAHLRDAPRDIPFQLDAQTLANGDSFTFTTNLGDVDVLGMPKGTRGFSDLEASAVHVAFGDDLTIVVAGLDDLIRMKMAAGRTKDLRGLEFLRAVQKERQRPIDPDDGGEGLTPDRSPTR
jgi:hypothetical protein